MKKFVPAVLVAALMTPLIISAVSTYAATVQADQVQSQYPNLDQNDLKKYQMLVSEFNLNSEQQALTLETMANIKSSKQDRGLKTWAIKQALQYAAKLVGKAGSPAWLEIWVAKISGAQQDVENMIYQALKSLGVDSNSARWAAKLAASLLT